MKLTAQTLDTLIPLESASHMDVVSLGIDTPMRYSECFATLRNGCIVRLRNSSQLLGWSGKPNSRNLYFKAGKQLIRIRTDAKRRRQIRQIESWSEFSACAALSFSDTRVKKIGSHAQAIVSRDGSLSFVAPLAAEMPEWTEMLREAGRHAPTHSAALGAT